MLKTTIILFVLAFIGVSPAVLQAQSPPPPLETLLGAYMEDGYVSGGFSPYWLAYLIEEDGKTFVELNGERLGPYSSVSPRFEVSPDGKHIAYAAQREGVWYLVVDGEERWSHEHLGWQSGFFVANLEGNTIINQYSAFLHFSPNGEQLAYQVFLSDEEKAMYVNGTGGPVVSSISVNMEFVGNTPLYTAWDENDSALLILGKQAFGPYETVWPARVSGDHSHFVTYAQSSDQFFLIVDGQEQEMPSRIGRFTVGTNGELAYTYEVDGRWRVRFQDYDLPGEFDEVFEPVISPDGNHIAFFARDNSIWTLVTDLGSFSGFDGYWIYEIGTERYHIIWGEESENLAYYARQGEDVLLAINGEALPLELAEVPGMPGASFIDEQRKVVGLRMITGSSIDRYGLVQCLILWSQLECDPTSAVLINHELAYIEHGEEESVVVIGERREGPYTLTSGLLVSDDHRHYAYIISSDLGQQVVLDGLPMDFIYESIHRPMFNDGEFAHLGVKEGNVFSVQYPVNDD